MALSDGDRIFVYGPGDLPLEQVDNASGTATWFHHDQLGSTRLLTDNAGAAVGTFTYDAYGNLTGRSGPSTTPLGYAGEYTDTETGMQYLRARYYDPATGQFVSRDPIEALTRSAYAYVYGSPVNATDPLGLGCIIHNSHGGCLGSGVLEEAQEPINNIGLVAAGLSAASSIVSLGCAAGGNLICTAVAKGVSTSFSLINTLATAETTVYACNVGGTKSTACQANASALAFSLVNTFVGLFVDPVSQTVLANANFIASIASYNSRLTDVNANGATSALSVQGGYC